MLTLKDIGQKFTIRVMPNASTNKIKITPVEGQPPLIQVYVTCVPEDGKANAAVVKLLAKALGVPKSSLTITHGLKGRDKTIMVNQ